MNKIYSRVDPGRLLHVIFNTSDLSEGRTDLSDPQQWLQVSVMNLAPARKVGPHLHVEHVERVGSTPTAAQITQECWIVLRGEITAALFDLDRRPLSEHTLLSGHLLLTFGGGHSLECGGAGAMMVECKNGPYVAGTTLRFEASSPSPTKPTHR